VEAGGRGGFLREPRSSSLLDAELLAADGQVRGQDVVVGAASDTAHIAGEAHPEELVVEAVGDEAGPGALSQGCEVACR
jgi:hypothetical protein